MILTHVEFREPVILPVGGLQRSAKGPEYEIELIEELRLILICRDGKQALYPVETVRVLVPKDIVVDVEEDLEDDEE